MVALKIYSYITAGDTNLKTTIPMHIGSNLPHEITKVSSFYYTSDSETTTVPWLSKKIRPHTSLAKNFASLRNKGDGGARR